MEKVSNLKHIAFSRFLQTGAQLSVQSQSFSRLRSHILHDFTVLSLPTPLLEGQVQWLRPRRGAAQDGFMVDVWWGITEPDPKTYNFAPYRNLIDQDRWHGCPLRKQWRSGAKTNLRAILKISII